MMQQGLAVAGTGPHERFIDDAEKKAFSLWFENELNSGGLGEVPVPEAVINRSLGPYSWRWLVDLRTGEAWQLNKWEIMPLELPPSLESLRPKIS